jgi:hypothetical protein
LKAENSLIRGWKAFALELELEANKEATNWVLFSGEKLFFLFYKKSHPYILFPKTLI